MVRSGCPFDKPEKVKAEKILTRKMLFSCRILNVYHWIKIPIDSHVRKTYYWLVMTWTRPYNILLLLLLGTYIIAPVLDVVACDDCNYVLSLQAEQKDLSNGSCPSDSTARTADQEKNLPSDPGMDEDLCPLCSNTAAGMQSQASLAPVLTVHVVGMPTLLALLDPSYPINKPPQN